ncbi:36747_t:CDS:2, partial [Gigaspora margarita]
IIISQKEYKFLKAQGLIEDEENKNTMNLDEYLSREEFEVSDPERPHNYFNLL